MYTIVSVLRGTEICSFCKQPEGAPSSAWGNTLFCFEVASLPFAGITRIRFYGYDLSPFGRAPLVRFSGTKVRGVRVNPSKKAKIYTSGFCKLYKNFGHTVNDDELNVVNRVIASADF